MYCEPVKSFLIPPIASIGMTAVFNEVLHFSKRYVGFLDPSGLAQKYLFAFVVIQNVASELLNLVLTSNLELLKKHKNISLICVNVALGAVLLGLSALAVRVKLLSIGLTVAQTAIMVGSSIASSLLMKWVEKEVDKKKNEKESKEIERDLGGVNGKDELKDLSDDESDSDSAENNSGVVKNYSKEDSKTLLDDNLNSN